MDKAWPDDNEAVKELTNSWGQSCNQSSTEMERRRTDNA